MSKHEGNFPFIFLCVIYRHNGKIHPQEDTLGDMEVELMFDLLEEFDKPQEIRITKVNREEVKEGFYPEIEMVMCEDMAKLMRREYNLGKKPDFREIAQMVADHYGYDDIGTLMAYYNHTYKKIKRAQKGGGLFD